MSEASSAAVPPEPPGVVPVRGPAADLNLLRTFLSVYRAGSLTAAAPALGLSQPTVTAQIRTLEERSGRQLFTRLPRGVQPTAAAHELAGRIAGPLDALAAADHGQDEPRTTPVRLAGPSELLCTRVLPALAGVVADGVELRVTQGMTDPLLEEMRAGRQDLVITTRRPRGRGLVSVPLGDEEYVLVTSPDWAARIACRRDAEAAELCVALREVPLVSYAEDLPIVRRYWRTVFGKPAPAGHAALTVPNLHAVVAAVVAGAGYSVLPHSLCVEHLAAGRLAALDEPEEPPLNTLFLVQRPGADTDPAVIRVRDTLHRAARTWR
ncbi:MAG: LysR family transcriptional regulator [Nocardioides sp.]|uniref:LysR family transcriptional regulator n=1 Tax=Nocardioides sp. TaxID=35761 RepID=UPI0039E6B063